MLSTIANFRIGEMAGLYSKSFSAIVQSENRNYLMEFTEFAPPRAFAVLLVAQKHSLAHFKKFIQDDEVWKNYKLRCVEVKLAIDSILTFTPNSTINPDVLSLGITIIKELIEGWNYMEAGSVGESVRKIGGNLKINFLNDFNEYVDQMKNINPQYIPPTIQEKKEHCFIATATMGSYDHPYVISLRNSRDDVLLQSNLGTRIVGIYYQKSPFFARIITRSSFLRKTSLLLVVKPWVWLAGFIERNY